MVSGFIAGTFDLCHPGHLLSFIEAKKYCDELTIGLHIDPSFERKEKNSPVESLFERYLRLLSNKNIDTIFPYSTEKELNILVEFVNPDIIFLGDDYKNKPFTISNYARAGTEVIYLTRYGYSSTALRNRLTSS